jgi:hypothetical protein
MTTHFISTGQPVFGTTWMKAVVSDGTDILPDCDFDKEKRGSTFAEPLSGFTVGRSVAFLPDAQAPTGVSGHEILAGFALGPLFLAGLAVNSAETLCVPGRAAQSAASMMLHVFRSLKQW